MATGRAAGSDDAVGIDAQHGGILPQPPDGTLGVLDAGVRRDIVPGLHPVIGPCRHHAPAGQVSCLRLELLDGAVGPAAAEEEDDGGPLVLLFPVRREMDMDGEIGLLGLLVGEGLDGFLGRFLGEGGWGQGEEEGGGDGGFHGRGPFSKRFHRSIIPGGEQLMQDPGRQPRHDRQAASG